ncbi:hypothetical protein RRG08_030141 [Elysia crispata]|uniref:Uncharacterized protein n=1 Tax=Elysia crispata TaxID=231223 RepID=A0AAE1DKG7_9GAST|nr:hypothetical protein RRG08_030141 [Elysia crispata]
MCSRAPVFHTLNILFLEFTSSYGKLRSQICNILHFHYEVAYVVGQPNAGPKTPIRAALSRPSSDQLPTLVRTFLDSEDNNDQT